MAKFPPGTWIERDLFISKAYISLKGVAPQLLTLILGKRKFETQGRKGKQKRICVNGDCLSFTYIEGLEYGITKPRFTKAINELLAKGFITIIHQGGAYRQDKSLYGLCEKWQIWKPGIVFEKRKPDTIKRGFQGAKKQT